MDNDDKEPQLPEVTGSKEEQGSISSNSTGGNPEEEEDYVPDDGEDNIDDEATLEEQESLENDADVADEVAALQEEQDIPVEELMRLYGYNKGVESTSTSTAPEAFAKSAGQPNSQSADSYSSPSSSSQCEPGSTAVTRQVLLSYFSGGNGNHVDEDDEDEVDGGADNEHGYFSTSDEDSENDYDYIPEEAWRKEIKVGPEHQAEVPASVISPLDEIDSPDELDDCMWSPNTTIVSEETVEQYLKSALTSVRAVQRESDPKNGSGENSDGPAAPHPTLKRKIECSLTEGEDEQISSVRDEETALQLLYESQYDIEKALADWKRSLVERKQKEFSPDNPDRLWTEEEQTVFEEGLKAHGKNFRLIQEEFLPNRRTRDLVRYYYLWKRTERHDVFVQTYRFEKRQCSLHPTASDYMDHFLDHMALVGATSSVAASAFQPADNPQNIHALHQSHHYAYLSLIPSSTNARHHHIMPSSQKGDSEEVVVAEDLTNTHGPVSGE